LDRIAAVKRSRAQPPGRNDFVFGARHGRWRCCRYSASAADILPAGLGAIASDLFKLTEECGKIFWTLLTQLPA